MIALAAFGFFAQDGLNTLRILLNNTFEQKVLFDLRSDLYGRLQSLPLTWFDHRATGDIMTRVVEDVGNVERVLIDGIEQGAVAILQIAVVFGLMLSWSPALALCALTPVPFLIAGALAYTLTAGQRYGVQRRAASDLNSLLHDNLDGIRQIKGYARETAEHERFNTTSEKLRQTTRANRSKNSPAPIPPTPPTPQVVIFQHPQKARGPSCKAATNFYGLPAAWPERCSFS
jgi:ATP-binding cassette subfamily B protein